MILYAQKVCTECIYIVVFLKRLKMKIYGFPNYISIENLFFINQSCNISMVVISVHLTLQLSVSSCQEPYLKVFLLIQISIIQKIKAERDTELEEKCEEGSGRDQQIYLHCNCDCTLFCFDKYEHKKLSIYFPVTGFVISHATNFQRHVFGDTKYFTTEFQGFCMYFTHVRYYRQNLVNYHHSFQTVSFLKRDLL